MLNKVKNQEKLIMNFFVVMLFIVGIYVVLERELIDVIYFGVLVYYFIRFLLLKKMGGSGLNVSRYTLSCFFGVL